MYSGTPLDIKKIIAFLHTLSTYNNLLVRYKVYLSDLGECLCTSEGMLKPMKTLVFSIDPAPYRKNPIKNKIVKPNCQPLLLGEDYTEINV